MTLNYTSHAQDQILSDDDATLEDLREIAEFLDTKAVQFDDQVTNLTEQLKDALKRIEELEEQINDLNYEAKERDTRS